MSKSSTSFRLKNNEGVIITPLSHYEFSTIPRIALQELSLYNSSLETPLLAFDLQYLPKLYMASLLLDKNNNPCLLRQNHFYLSFQIELKDKNNHLYARYYLTLHALGNHLFYDLYRHRQVLGGKQSILLKHVQEILLYQCQTHLEWLSIQPRPFLTFHKASTDLKSLFGYNPKDGYFTEEYTDDKRFDFKARLSILERKFKTAQKNQGKSQ